MRDFDLARRERAAKRTPVQFQLGGEHFTLLPTVPLGAAFDLHDAPEPDPTDADSVRPLVAFIEQALVDEDQPKWQALMRRRTDAIDPEAILETALFLVEAYTARPTVPSIGSSGGRARTGRPSKKPGRKAS